MDTKRMISGMILAMLVIFGYRIFIVWLWKHNNWNAPGGIATTQQVIPATNPSDRDTASADTATSAHDLDRRRGEPEPDDAGGRRA